MSENVNETEGPIPCADRAITSLVVFLQRYRSLPLTTGFAVVAC